MVIFRYLAKEVALTLIALTCILLLIFLSNQFVQYLTRAAAGQIPVNVVFNLMLLEIPNLIALLLPLGFFIALLVVLGRLYSESEMVVLEACGFSQAQLCKMTLVMAIVVALIGGGLSLWVSPIVSEKRDYLITGGGASAAIQAIREGRFESQGGGQRVLYIEGKSRDQKHVERVFLAELASEPDDGQPGVWDIVVAKRGYVEPEMDLGAESIILEDGRQYEGLPGQADFRIVKFDRYQARFPMAAPYIRKEQQAMPTHELLPFNNPDLEKAAEIQWRLSVPLMALVLGLLAIPISRVKPRQGKYARLLPAILLYVLYANMMFIGRDWLSQGKIPAVLGLWWLHALMVLLAVILLMFPYLRRRFRR